MKEDRKHERDEIDQTIEDIKEFAKDRGFRLFELDIGDFEKHRVYKARISWKEFILYNQNPGAFHMKEYHAPD